MRLNNTINKKMQRRFDTDVYKLITKKKETLFTRFFQLSNRKGLQGHRYKLARRQKVPSSKDSSAAGWSTPGMS
jgi:hypothetical protein